VQQLQEENKQLQAELQYLQELLSLWQPQTCSICQLHSSNTQSSSKVTRSRASRTARDSASAHAAVDRILRQQQVLIAQQQCQLLALQVGGPWGLVEVVDLSCSADPA
jgi:transcriptional regulator with GAF, ATPase, and Fis domain